MEMNPLPICLCCRMSVNIRILIEMVSGEEADVVVRIRTQVVQVQSGRASVRSVVEAAATDRHCH